MELTLIQLSQLTGDADEIGSGRGPKLLKPLFQKAVAAASTSLPNNSKPAQSTSTYNTAQASQPQDNAAQQQYPVGSTPPANHPISQLTSRSTTPTMMSRPKGISIRTGTLRNTQEKTSANQATTSANQALPTASQSVAENLPINEDGARICWKQFASTLPKEESAMAGRLMNIRPQLNGETNIVVTTDNKIVAQELQSMKTRIEEYMRKQMQNNLINIDIVLEATQTNQRIYSRVEQYQVLEQRNPSLKRLKELMDLDLD